MILTNCVLEENKSEGSSAYDSEKEEEKELENIIKYNLNSKYYFNINIFLL